MREGAGEGGGGQSLGFADNLKCVSSSDGDLLEAAWFTNGHIHLVGQSPAPDKCVLLGTSSVVRSGSFSGGLSSWMLGTWEGTLIQLTVGELPLLLVVGGYSGCDGSSAELCWQASVSSDEVLLYMEFEASRISFSLLQRLRAAFVGWHMLVFALRCWTDHLVVTLNSMWFGAVSDFCEGTIAAKR